MTEYFVMYDFATGSQLLRGSGAPGTTSAQTPPAGYGIISVPASVYDGGLASAPVAVLRTSVWDQVKARRDALIDAGAPTTFGTMDADLVSRVNISGAATAALAATVLSQPFSVDWTTTANTAVTLTAAQMIQMGMEVMAYVSGCHDRARTLRLGIEAATDAATLLTIDYTAGWP